MENATPGHRTTGKAITVKKTFSRETSVSTEIHAAASIVWSLLVNARDYPRWNKTVVSLEGEIGPGKKIKLRSVLDPKRTFHLTVKEFLPPSKLVWGDTNGTRVFMLKDEGPGKVIFSMTERIGGFMFPMYARFIPPFDESFETFAAGLKKEAEIIQNTKN